MKKKTLIVVTVLALFACAVFAQDVAPITPEGVVPLTNAPPALVADSIKPLKDLLGGAGTWITTIVAWLGAISLVLAPFTVKIQHALANAMNNAAASKEDVTDDEYLRRLFGYSWYKFGTFLLRFANIRFPTLSDLERAIKLQNEAVNEAFNPNPLNDTTKKV